MIARNLLAALAVVVVPLAVAGHAQAPSQSKPRLKRICEVDQPIGSRLGAVRRCMTEAEWIEARAEAQKTVQRIQSGKAGSGTLTGGGACRAAGPRGC